MFSVKLLFTNFVAIQNKNTLSVEDPYLTCQ